jgi:rare lipoprotein A
MCKRLLAAQLGLTLLLAGCASGPATWRGRDGPESNPPADLQRVPDARPQVEVLRPGGPNKPYEVLGRSYTPIQDDRTFSERGLASWYGRKFHGRSTANGETYNMYAMTAAHPTLPIPSYVRVRNPANQREVIVRINDRGPFYAGRIIDLSYTAALKLDLLRAVAPVEIERLTHEQIRSGSWRREGVQADPVAATTEPAMPAPAVVAQAPEPAAQAPARELPAAAAPGFWVQLGAFTQLDGALSFQRRAAQELESLAPLLAIFSDRSTHRLQAGPFASRGEAGSLAQRIREVLQLVPVIVERR